MAGRSERSRELESRIGFYRHGRRGKVELGEGAGDARWPTGQVFGGHGCHGRKQRREKGEGLRRKFERKSGV